jgi:hypothetical protein
VTEALVGPEASSQSAPSATSTTLFQGNHQADYSGTTDHHEDARIKTDHSVNNGEWQKDWKSNNQNNRLSGSNTTIAESGSFKSTSDDKQNKETSTDDSFSELDTNSTNIIGSNTQQAGTTSGNANVVDNEQSKYQKLEHTEPGTYALHEESSDSGKTSIRISGAGQLQKIGEAIQNMNHFLSGGNNSSRIHGRECMGETCAHGKRDATEQPQTELMVVLPGPTQNSSTTSEAESASGLTRSGGNGVISNAPASIVEGFMVLLVLYLVFLLGSGLRKCMKKRSQRRRAAKIMDDVAEVEKARRSSDA